MSGKGKDESAGNKKETPKSRLSLSLRTEVRSPGLTSRLSSYIINSATSPNTSPFYKLRSYRDTMSISPRRVHAVAQPKYDSVGLLPRVKLNQGRLPVLSPNNTRRVKIAPSRKSSPLNLSTDTRNNSGTTDDTSSNRENVLPSRSPMVPNLRRLVTALQEMSARKRDHSQLEDPHEDEEEEDSNSKRARRDSSSSVGSSLSMEMPPLFSNGVVGQTTSQLVNREAELSLNSLLSRSQGLFHSIVAQDINRSPGGAPPNRSVMEKEKEKNSPVRMTRNEITCSLSSSLCLKRSRDVMEGRDDDYNDENNEDFEVGPPVAKQRAVTKDQKSPKSTPPPMIKSNLKLTNDIETPPTLVLPDLSGIASSSAKKKLMSKMKKRNQGEKPVLSSSKDYQKEKERAKLRANSLLSSLGDDDEKPKEGNTLEKFNQATQTAADVLPMTSPNQMSVLTPRASLATTSITSASASTTSTPTSAPTISTPTLAPTTSTPTSAPTTSIPTSALTTSTPTLAPTTSTPTLATITSTPTLAPTTSMPPATTSFVVPLISLNQTSIPTLTTSTPTVSSTLDKPVPTFHFGLTTARNFGESKTTSASSTVTFEAKPNEAKSTETSGFGGAQSSNPLVKNPNSTPFGNTTATTTSDQPKATSSSSLTTQSTTSSSGFNFGSNLTSKPADPAAPAVFTFGTQANSTSTSKSFTFGANTTTPANPSPFGSSSNSAEPKKGFSFGSTSSQPQASASQGSSGLFQFGANKTTSASSVTFDGKTNETKPTETSGFGGAQSNNPFMKNPSSTPFGNPPAFGTTQATSFGNASANPLSDTTKVTSSSSLTSQTTTSSSGFSFGSNLTSKPSDPAAPAVFTFGGQANSTSTSKPFTFGANTTTPANPSPFGSSSNSAEPKKGFSFGSTSSQPQASASQGSSGLFQFGANKTTSASSVTFDGKTNEAKPTETSGFGGAQSNNPFMKNPSSTPFGNPPAFGATQAASFGNTTATPTSNQPKATASSSLTSQKTTSSSGFSFGSNLTSKPSDPAAPAVFTFGAQANSTSTSKPFTFGANTTTPANPSPFGTSSNSAAPQKSFSFGSTSSQPQASASQGSSGLFQFGANKTTSASSAFRFDAKLNEAKPTESSSFGGTQSNNPFMSNNSSAPFGNSPAFGSTQATPFGTGTATPNVGQPGAMFNIGAGSAPKGRTIVRARRTRRN